MIAHLSGRSSCDTRGPAVLGALHLFGVQQAMKRFLFGAALALLALTPREATAGMCGIGAKPGASRFIIASRTARGLETSICLYAFGLQDFRTAVGEGSPPPKQ